MVVTIFVSLLVAAIRRARPLPFNHLSSLARDSRGKLSQGFRPRDSGLNALLFWHPALLKGKNTVRQNRWTSKVVVMSKVWRHFCPLNHALLSKGDCYD